MASRITCDCCGKELGDTYHVALTHHKVGPDNWGEVKDAHFCNIYACLPAWLKAQGEKYGWNDPAGKIVGQAWSENGAVMDGN